MATFRFLSYNSPDTAVAGSTMNGLALGGFAYGSEIDNSATSSTGVQLIYGDLTIALASAVTAVAPAFVTVYLLPNIDGNYTQSSGDPSTGYLVATATGTGGSLQYLQCRGILLTPNKFKIVIQNNLGIAFPASNSSVCSLYRYSETVM